MKRAEAEAVYEQGRDVVVDVLLALSVQNERLEAQVEKLTAKVVAQDERIASLERQRRRCAVRTSACSRTPRPRPTRACLSPGAVLLLDQTEQERRLAGWGSVLAGLDRENSPVRRLQWIERTVPSDGDQVARYLQEERLDLRPSGVPVGAAEAEDVAVERLRSCHVLDGYGHEVGALEFHADIMTPRALPLEDTNDTSEIRSARRPR